MVITSSYLLDYTCCDPNVSLSKWVLTPIILILSVIR